MAILEIYYADKFWQIVSKNDKKNRDRRWVIFDLILAEIDRQDLYGTLFKMVSLYDCLYDDIVQLWSPTFLLLKCKDL